MLNLSRAAVILLFFLAPLQIQANSVVFDEIAWMGTINSSNDEWIRLYNNTENSIILDGWKINLENGAKQIILNGEIRPKGYYLLERTDDTTLPDILADLIYTGALNNSGEKLELYNDSNSLIDSLDCSLGWFAGDNKTKQTMKRIDPNIESNNSENWENSGTLEVKKDEQEKTKTLLNESNKIYPGNIIFSEILPSPEGSDAENEWIEIFNNNNFDVDISGWKIIDTIGATKTYVFPEKTIIKAKGFLVATRPETNITMNNDGDSLKILRPNETIADAISYEKAINGQSYSLIENKWAWSSILTPNAINALPFEEKPLEAVSETNDKVEENDNLAFIGGSYQKTVSQKKDNFSFSSTIIAIIISLACGAIILVLKISLLKK